MSKVYLTLLTCVVGAWEILDSIVFFCYRKVMFLKLCSVSMLSIDLRFVTFLF